MSTIIKIYKPTNGAYIDIQVWKLGIELGWFGGIEPCLLKFGLLEPIDKTVFITHVQIIKLSVSIYFDRDDS